MLLYVASHPLHDPTASLSYPLRYFSNAIVNLWQPLPVRTTLSLSQMQLPYRPQSSPRVSAHLHPGGTYPTFPFDAPSGYPVQLVEQENIDGPTQNQDLQTQHQIRQLAVSLVRTPCPDRPRLTHGSNKPALKVNRKAIVSANRPIKPRKKKAPTLNADAWQPYKARIIELYREHDLPLKAVKAKIEEEYPHFTAEYVPPAGSQCKRTI